MERCQSRVNRVQRLAQAELGPLLVAFASRQWLPLALRLEAERRILSSLLLLGRRCFFDS